ncbi:hypothetical protein [Amycolatopsis sp. cmx-8-4]|uniref:hypothetical protein n=1 Tax=Amycolatopsis sp. cmx-8-4 TaxID=2790947 RepID=UPI00397DA135
MPLPRFRHSRVADIATVLLGGRVLSGVLAGRLLGRYLLARPVLTTGLPGRLLSRPFSRTILLGRRFGGTLGRRRVLLSCVATRGWRRLSGVFPGRRLFDRTLRGRRFRRTRGVRLSGELLRRRRDGRSRSLVSRRRTMHWRLLRGAIHRLRLLESPGRLVVRTARTILLGRTGARRRHHTRVVRRPPTRRRWRHRRPSTRTLRPPRLVRIPRRTLPARHRPTLRRPPTRRHPARIIRMRPAL